MLHNFTGVSSSPPIPVIVSVVLVIVLVISAAAVTIIVTIKVKKKKGVFVLFINSLHVIELWNWYINSVLNIIAV